MNRSVSIKDVANHASVAVGTVSNVLNQPDRVSEPTRRHVQQAVAGVPPGYVQST